MRCKAKSLIGFSFPVQSLKESETHCAVTDDDQCAQHDAGRVKAHEEGHGQLHVDGVYVLGKAIHYTAYRGCIKEYHGSVQNSVQHLLVNDS